MSQKNPEKSSMAQVQSDRPDAGKAGSAPKEKNPSTAERFRRSDTGEAEVPPVIVKGGSLDVEFPRVPFIDAGDGSRVVLARGPLEGPGHVGQITLVEYRHKVTKEVIASHPRPAGLDHRDCLVVVWDDQ